MSHQCPICEIDVYAPETNLIEEPVHIHWLVIALLIGGFAAIYFKTLGYFSKPGARNGALGPMILFWLSLVLLNWVVGGIAWVLVGLYKFFYAVHPKIPSVVAEVLAVLALAEVLMRLRQSHGIERFIHKYVRKSGCDDDSITVAILAGLIVLGVSHHLFSHGGPSKKHSQVVEQRRAEAAPTPNVATNDVRLEPARYAAQDTRISCEPVATPLSSDEVAYAEKQGFFTIGSSRKKVIQIQKWPLKYCSMGGCSFNGSSVRFADGRVIDFVSSLGALRALCPKTVKNEFARYNGIPPTSIARATP